VTAVSTVLEWKSRLAETYRLSRLGKYDKAMHESMAGSLGIATQAHMSAPEHVATSELLWVSAEMIDVVHHAARSLPLYNWSPELLPWPKAICVGEKPLVVLPHERRADGIPHFVLQWSNLLAPSYDCTVLLWHYEKGFHWSPVASLIFNLTSGHAWPEVSDGMKLSGARDIGAAAVEETTRFVSTLWLLLQQKVAVKRVTIANRATRRRAEKAGDSVLPTVTVIELRRPISQQESEGSGGPVEWSHRWMVGGHWRNQYYPSTGGHLPMWIAPYVKGPEDKPLVVKDRVYAWVR
jgi:hypothetical protein